MRDITYVWCGVMVGLVILLVTTFLLSSQNFKADIALLTCWSVGVAVIITCYVTILTAYCLAAITSRELLICQAMFTLITFMLTLSLLFGSRQNVVVRTYKAHPVTFYSIVGLISLYIIGLIIVNSD